VLAITEVVEADVDVSLDEGCELRYIMLITQSARTEQSLSIHRSGHLRL
jgi:hypothetical protein